VVVVKGGEVQKAFDGDSIVQALKDYLAEQETKDAEADS
jgi:hypothetical protein